MDNTSAGFFVIGGIAIFFIIIAFLIKKYVPDQSPSDSQNDNSSTKDVVNTQTEPVISKEVNNTIPLPSHLINTDLAQALKVVGWIYFLFSLIGGIILWAGSSERVYVRRTSLYDVGEYVERVDVASKAIGIVGVFTSFIVLLICLGIARIIEQNSYLLTQRNN